MVTQREVREAMYKDPATLTCDAASYVDRLSLGKKQDNEEFMSIEYLTNYLKKFVNMGEEQLLGYGCISPRLAVTLKKTINESFQKGKYLGERKLEKEVETATQIILETSLLVHELENVKNLSKERLKSLRDFLLILTDQFMALNPAPRGL